jgi:hypothetical protein
MKWVESQAERIENPIRLRSQVYVAPKRYIGVLSACSNLLHKRK